VDFLPPVVPFSTTTEAPSPSVAQAEPSTELDLYSAFLANSSNSPSQQSLIERHLDERNDEARNQEQNQEQNTTKLFSTLTTTERTTAPDGSVVTKVVLKKRFQDGREEIGETVHHSNIGEAASRSWEQPLSGGQMESDGKLKEGKKSRGWFWSG
jgi:hypothetical protein